MQVIRAGDRGRSRGGRAFHARHAARDRVRRGAGTRPRCSAAGATDPPGRPPAGRRHADRAAGPGPRFAGEGPDPGRRRAGLPVPPRRVRGRPAAAARGPRAPRGAGLAGDRRAGGRGRRAAVRRWSRPGIRPDRHRADDDGAGHAAADPAREPPAGRPARRPPACGRRDRRAAADHRGRPFPRHDQPVRRAHLAGGRRGRRVRPDPAVAVVPRRADPHVHRGGRARDHADERPRHRSAADPVARGDRGVPSGRGARRLRGRHGAAAVGGHGPAVAGGQAGRARLRLLHPGLLRLLGDGDGPAVDGLARRCGC